MRAFVRFVCFVALFGLIAERAAAQLALAIEAGPDRVRAQLDVTVELTATNTGAVPIANVTLELDLPASVFVENQNLTTFGGTCTGSGNLNTQCDPGESVTWALGTLAPGARKTVTIAPVVFGGVSEPANGTVFTFNARLREAGVLRATASETATKQAASVFELFVDDDADPVVAGADLTYTLVYGKLVAGDSLGTTLSFALPAGTSFVSASDGGSFAAGSVTWNLGTLGGGLGGTRQVTLHVNAPLADGTLLRATAQLQDAAANIGRAQSVTAVQSDSPLELAVEAFSDPGFAASEVVVEITATNVGVGAIDTVLELRLDEYLAGFAENLSRTGVCTISGNVNTTCDGRERVRWDLPALAPGERATVTLPPRILASVSEPAEGTLIPFRAELYQPLAGQIGESRLARFTVRKHNTREFELAVDESDDPVAPGAPLTYTVAFGKPVAGTSNATTLALELPPETSFVSATHGGSHSGGVVTWNLGTVNAGQSGTRQVKVNVDPLADEGAILHTTARIRDDATTSRVARSAGAAVVQSGSPFRLSIDASPDPTRTQETADVELTVTNVGGTTREPVLELRLDEYFAGFNENLLSHGGDCSVSSTSGAINATCDGRERIRWELEPLAPGERISLTLAPQVFGSVSEPPDATLLLLRAELFEELGGQIGESRLARQLIRKQNVKNVEIQLDESADPIAPGANLSYTLSFGKPDAGDLSGATLTFALPAGTSFVSASDGGTLASGVVTWNLGIVPPGQGGTRRVTVHVDTPVADGTVLEASAHAQHAGATSARARASTVVRAGSPFALAIVSAPDPVVTQEAVDTQITVSNVGAVTVDPVLDLRLDDVLFGFNQNHLTGDGVCNVSGAAPNTSCDAREFIRWDLAPLAPGEHVTVSLAPQVNGSVLEPPDGTLIPFRAEVYVPAVGQTEERRIARNVVRKQNAHTFELLADESSDPVAPGTNLTYTLTFGHPVIGTAAGNVLSFPLPAGTSFVSATGGGVLAGNVVLWNLPALPAGQGGSRQVTVQVGAGLASGSLLTTVAELQDGQLLPSSARVPVVTAVQSAAPLRLSVTATPDPARPTNVLDVDLTVNNLSGALVSGAVLQARVPDTIATFAETATTGGGDCNVSGAVPDANCGARERVVWALPDIPAGGSVSVSMPPQIFGGVATPPDGTLIRFFSVVDGSQSLNNHTVRVGFLDSDADGVIDGVDNCGAVANANQADGDADLVGDLCDNCPTLANYNLRDADGDLVGDVCDNCVTAANARVAANFLTLNPWATLSGGQRDDDHDGYGNQCDANFIGPDTEAVGPLDLAQYRSASGKSRTLDICGTGTAGTTRPCAIFDLDGASDAIGPTDLARYRLLSGIPPGPKCAACTGNSGALPCTAGASGSCN